jgi:MutS domain V/MutS domain III
VALTDQQPATTAAVETVYERARGERHATAGRYERLHARLSYIRLALVGAGIAILVLGGWRAAIWLPLPLALFALVALIHGRVLNARDRAQSAEAFYARGLLRIRHAWIGHGRTGDDHRPAEHLFADDLDIFGRGSLFELLATTRTRAGEEVLARWLLTPADEPEIQARQEAVRELAGRLPLREAVAVLGDQVRTAVDAPVLRAWADSPVRLTGTGRRLALAALAATTAALLAGAMQVDRLGTAALLSVGLEAIVAFLLRSRVEPVVDAVAEPAHDLDVLVSLLRLLEGERFRSPRLEHLRLALGGEHHASRQVGRLSRYVAMLESRRNVMFALPAALVLWGTQWAFAIEAWRSRVGMHIPRWLDAVGEFEALLAVAGFAAEHPEYSYPTIVPAGTSFAARGLAHPALPADAVANDLDLARGGVQLVIVSGSNMSGKSTWLRTVGTTVVLVWMGAPVRAAACRLSALRIGAAIRVQDSLTDGRSHFFAEILRLKEIVDLTRSHAGNVLFLLDEILGGTNSHDRRAGADALLSGLVEAGAIGLATTHDLALAAIADHLPHRAANAHFRDDFVDGTLCFDYRLRDGVVTTSNALALMRSIGLRV